MLTIVASWIDRTKVRVAFGAIAMLSAVLLGPFALLLLALGPREPWLFLAGLGGVAGLLAGAARAWLGQRFFALPRGGRLLLVAAISGGVGATFLVALALPRNVYWATGIPLVGISGLVLLAGSITGPGLGPNKSLKLTD